MEAVLPAFIDIREIDQVCTYIIHTKRAIVTSECNRTFKTYRSSELKYKTIEIVCLNG